MSGSGSVDNFVHSLRRASQFRTLRQAFSELVPGDGTDEEHDAERPRASDQERTPGSDEQADESTRLLGNDLSHLPPLSGKVSEASSARIKALNKRRDESKGEGGNLEPTLVRSFERDDGTRADVIVGQSTVPQTIFNATNVLVGVGLLGLPLGIAYAGWIIGLVLLLAVAAMNKYTGSLLARCMDVDSSLSNYADIAYIAFGEVGRVTTSTLFTIELVGINTALIILLADTLANLMPHVGVLTWKIIAGVVLLPTNFVPLRYLSYASFISVFGIGALIILILVAGGLKSEQPGSLHELATTYALPKYWRALPLSFGLIMAPWSGLSVFPNVYRDMQQPAKFNRSLWYTIVNTTLFNFIFAIVGYLMFGSEILDEVTKNVLQTKGYPFALKVMILIMVAIIPLTKFALINHPVVDTLEVVTGIDYRSQHLKPNKIARSRTLRLSLKAFYRVLVTFVVILLAIVVPSFELVTAIMGALFGYLICVVLPVLFHLRMFWHEISVPWRIFDVVLIVTSTALGLSGTAWEFVPKSWIGTE